MTPTIPPGTDQLAPWLGPLIGGLLFVFVGCVALLIRDTWRKRAKQ